MIEAALGFLAVFVLAFMRVPLALAMSIVGLAGLGLMRGWTPAFASTSQVIFETGFQYVLSVIPLFVLMGNFVARAGMARELYAAANAFVGHRRGGLAMASIIASGGFGSICGSSIATAATMTRVAYPEMKRHGYRDTLATGAIASGGTLGILIPPSTIMVIYGIITETDIGKLFIAGILPGLVAVICLCLALVSILRAGNGLLDGILELIPAARVGFVGLYRDPETLEPVQYYSKLPAELEGRMTIVVDPMLATGNSSVAALDLIKAAGAKNIRFLCLLASPEGIQRMKEAHPDVPIVTASVDERIDDHGYIVPGLGDAGDRMFGTK